MTDTTRSSRKHAGMPGSLQAIRIDYDRGTAAFDPLAADSAATVARVEMQKAACGTRLGEQPPWNSSIVPPGDRRGLPIRPMCRQQSEFQAVKAEYDYRASRLPDCGASAIFLPKSTKMQADRSQFLTAAEQSRRTGRNTGTASALSRNNTGQDGGVGPGWNCSTLPSIEQVNPMVCPRDGGAPAMRPLPPMSRRPQVNPATYVGPIGSHHRRTEQQRLAKTARREADLREMEEERRRQLEAAGAHGTVATFSRSAGTSGGGYLPWHATVNSFPAEAAWNQSVGGAQPTIGAGPPVALDTATGEGAALGANLEPPPTVEHTGPFTMANIDSWWDEGFDHRVRAAAAAIGYSGADDSAEVAVGGAEMGTDGTQDPGI